MNPSHHGGLRLTTTTAIATLAALLLAALALLWLGPWGTTTVLSGSMTPTAPTGSLAITRPAAATDIHPGDVIVLPATANRRSLMHRVVSVTHTDAGIEVRTRGDANNAVDPNPALLAARVPRVLLAIPHLGRLLGSPLLLVVVLIVAAAAVVAMPRRTPALAR